MPRSKRRHVIRDVIRALENGGLRFSLHALERMRERDILVSDVEEAIYSSQREEWKDRARSDAGWRYALRGMNLEGDKDLRIVVAFDGPMAVVVTVIDKNKGSDHE